MSMSMWVYEYMSIWVYEYMSDNMSIWEYEYMSMGIWVYEYMSIWVYEYMRMGIYDYMSIWISVCQWLASYTHEEGCVNHFFILHKAHEYMSMRWLRWVGFLKKYVSFAKEPYKRDYILQKRLIFSRSLLIIATPYEYMNISMWMACFLYSRGRVRKSLLYEEYLLRTYVHTCVMSILHKEHIRM